MQVTHTDQYCNPIFSEITTETIGNLLDDNVEQWPQLLIFFYGI